MKRPEDGLNYSTAKRFSSTVGITCEAHIDNARAVVGHLQTQRFVWCIPSLGGSLLLAPPFT